MIRFCQFCALLFATSACILYIRKNGHCYVNEDTQDVTVASITNLQQAYSSGRTETPMYALHSKGSLDTARAATAMIVLSHVSTGRTGIRVFSKGLSDSLSSILCGCGAAGGPGYWGIRANTCMTLRTVYMSSVWQWCGAEALACMP
ncbi:hypothetical protein ASPVEDRAFT_206797 [Aspergillus versicolor CBS 583.65]|uniref:Uncharacterized protein n=1 Tax=Aspergillus versicolor CBS 583.65 TaxID=1036611 RepID=A0A1L9P306_ASPVE|nr:uncharacterized protein ASPVEDRAFT_206797 [Aspergillus versicolor CBS 583.65]OJI95868.1 hypothetical protein ASPVEDRAFT_206797 [Aspergillus versicolor CBS 583.65]